MLELGVRERGFARLVLKAEADKQVALRLLESAVQQLHWLAGGNQLAAFRQERRIFHRDALGQIWVVSEQAIAVPDRKDTRDQFELAHLGRLLQPLDVLEVS